MPAPTDHITDSPLAIELNSLLAAPKHMPVMLMDGRIEESMTSRLDVVL